MESIPKNIHFIWLDKNNEQQNKIPEKYNKYLESWKQNNPEYDIKIWFNQDIYNLLKSIDQKYLNFFNNIKMLICKCDFIRMLIIYFTGGIYSDLDFFCLRPLDRLIENKSYLFFEEVPEHHFNGVKRLYNGFFASTKYNPFIFGWLEYIMKNWKDSREPEDVMNLTGPEAFYKYYKSNPIVELSNPCYIMAITDKKIKSKICKDEPMYALTLWDDGTSWTTENYVSKSKDPSKIKFLFILLFVIVLITILFFLKINMKIISFIIFIIFLILILTKKSISFFRKKTPIKLFYELDWQEENKELDSNITPPCDWENDYIFELCKNIKFEPVYFNNNKIEYINQDSTIENNIFVFNHLMPLDAVKNIVSKIKPKVIIQLSDEYGEYEEYQELAKYTKLYLRQHNFGKYEKINNIYQIPLGYMNKMFDSKYALDNIKTPIYERPYIWSFVGGIKADRQEMIDKFKSTFDKYYIGNNMTPQEMKKIYDESIFVPNGRGNVRLDCFRLYEAIFCGAIPIVVGEEDETNETFYFNGNKPPFIYAPNWDEAIEICKNLLQDKNLLEQVQKTQFLWLKNIIEDIQNKIENAINA